MSNLVNLPLQPVIATAILRVKLPNDRFKEIRVICDSGAQVNLLSEFTLQEMGLVSKPVKSNIVGINEMPVGTRGQIVLELWHRSVERPIVTSNFVTLGYFHLDHPQESFSHVMFPSLNESELADPHYNLKGRIDGIIGDQTGMQ